MNKKHAHAIHNSGLVTEVIIDRLAMLALDTAKGAKQATYQKAAAELAAELEQLLHRYNATLFGPAERAERGEI